MSEISVPTMPYAPDTPGAYGLITLPVFTCDLSLTAGAAYIARPSISLATLNNRKLTLTAGGKTLVGWGGGVTGGNDVTLTYAASGSSGITVADNDNIDFGTGNFTLVWRGSLPDWTPAATQILLTKWTDNVGYDVSVEASGTVQFYRNLDHNHSAVLGFVDGTAHDITIVVVRETAGADGSVIFYADGVQSGPTIVITAGIPSTYSNVAPLYLLGTSDARFSGTCSFAATFNRALTAAEVLGLYRNGINFADKWGSQTAILPTNNGFETDTSSPPTGWGNVGNQVGTAVADGTAPEGSRVLEVVASGAGSQTNSVYSTLDPLPITVGLKFRAKFYAKSVSGNTSLSVHPAMTPVTITSSWVEYTVDFTNDNRPRAGYIFLGGAGTARVDNLRFNQIGATLALEPEGINVTNWLDSSTNDLDASYPAAGSSITSTGAEVFKIVSAQGGATRDWTSDDGIDPNVASFALTVTAV
jgi:hypothetical protein